jgi:hypothetical protein
VHQIGHRRGVAAITFGLMHSVAYITHIRGVTEAIEVTVGRAITQMDCTEHDEQPIHEHDPEQHRIHRARERERERQHLTHSGRARS